jgi:quinol monooxygenase YgiN
MAEGGRQRSGSKLPAPSPEQATILAQLIAGPGRADAVRDALLQLVGPTREEPGNISYDVHRLKTNPAALYVLGNWVDQSALEAHFASAHVRSNLTERAARELVAPYTLWRAQMLSAPDTDPDRARPMGDSPAQVTLVPFFAVKRGEETTVGRCHLDMVGLTRAEPGCLGYDLYQSVDDPSLMFLYENWTDQSALDKHMNTSHFYRVVRGEVDRRLNAPWTAHVMTMISEPHRERITA